MALLEGLGYRTGSFFWDIDVLHVDEKRSAETAG
jgi:hypothetical protein